MTAEVQTPKRRRWWVRWLLSPLFGLILLIVLLVIASTEYPLLVVFTLLLGWIRFGYLALSAAQPNWTLVAEAGVCTAIVAVGGHWFLAWLYCASAGGEPRVWRIRWTGAGLAMIGLLFVTGISIIGITHQAVWLLLSKQPMFRNSWDGLMIGSEAMMLSDGYRAHMWDFHSQFQRWPESTQELFGAPLIPLNGHYIKSMRVEPGGRVIFQPVDRLGLDDEFEMYPVVNEDGGGFWKCAGTVKPLPASCRD